MTPIVLVPGLLCSADVFAPQVAALWPFGPVTIASTLVGDTMAAIAAEILAAAPPRFALGGISMGGYISLEIMRQAPERVLKLALIDTSARPDTPEQTAQRRQMIDLARRGSFEALLRPATAALFHPAHQADEALISLQVRMGLTVGVEGMARQQEAIIGRPDSRPGLQNIKVPTVVIVGNEDPLTPPAVAEEMANAIPGAKLVVISECGHGSTQEQPEAVNRALVDWIVG